MVAESVKKLAMPRTKVHQAACWRASIKPWMLLLHPRVSCFLFCWFLMWCFNVFRSEPIANQVWVLFSLVLRGVQQSLLRKSWVWTSCLSKALGTKKAPEESTLTLHIWHCLSLLPWQDAVIKSDEVAGPFLWPIGVFWHAGICMYMLVRVHNSEWRRIQPWGFIMFHWLWSRRTRFSVYKMHGFIGSVQEIGGLLVIEHFINRRFALGDVGRLRTCSIGFIWFHFISIHFYLLLVDMDQPSLLSIFFAVAVAIELSKHGLQEKKTRLKKPRLQQKEVGSGKDYCNSIANRSTGMDQARRH